MKKIAVMNSKGLIFGLIVLAFLFSFSNCKKENQLPSCTITYPDNDSWWSSTEDNCQYIDYDSIIAGQGWNQGETEISVRCVRDD